MFRGIGGNSTTKERTSNIEQEGKGVQISGTEKLSIMGRGKEGLKRKEKNLVAGIGRGEKEIKVKKKRKEWTRKTTYEGRGKKLKRGRRKETFCGGHHKADAHRGSMWCICQNPHVIVGGGGGKKTEEKGVEDANVEKKDEKH